MTVNDLKIQLESQKDLSFLREELKKYLEDHSFTTTLEQRERFLEDVFAIVEPNVQIDGVDVDKLGPETLGEEVDTQLEVKLEELQVETDALLVEITELRRTCPTHIRDAFVLGLEDLERAMPGVAQILTPPPTTTIKVDMGMDAIDKLVTELERLKALNNSIPQLVAKLQRARTVLTDSAQFDSATNGVMITTTTGGGGGGTIENLPEMLSRQRRIARQHDIAAKLLAQQ